MPVRPWRREPRPIPGWSAGLAAAFRKASQSVLARRIGRRVVCLSRFEARRSSRFDQSGAGICFARNHQTNQDDRRVVLPQMSRANFPFEADGTGERRREAAVFAGALDILSAPNAKVDLYHVVRDNASPRGTKD